MAELSTQMETAWDKSAVLLPNSGVARLSRTLQTRQPWISPFPFVECNMRDSHKTAVQFGLPDVSLTGLNEGIRPTQSTAAPQVFDTGTIEQRFEVDKDQIEIGSAADAQAQLDMQMYGSMDAMNKKAGEMIFYGNPESDSKEFWGLSSWYADGRAAAPDNRKNMLNAGASGSDLHSIWIIGFSKSTIYGIFPQGSKKGLKHKDFGKIWIEDAPEANGTGNRGRLEVYAQHYEWKLGLVIQDWRYGVRICNVPDHSTLDKDPNKAGATGNAAIDLVDLIHQGINRIYTPDTVNIQIFCNRDTYSVLDRQEKFGRQNSTLTRGQLYGRGIDNIHVRGAPVWWTDTLDRNETAIEF